MSIIEQEVLPSGLIQSISKLSYFKTERRKLACDTDSVGPNGQVRCKLPTSGLLSLSSLAYVAKLNITGEDAYVPTTGCFINTLRLSADGQILDEISHYDLLFSELLSLSCSTAHARSRAAMGCLQPVPTFVAVNTPAGSSDATNEAAAAVNVGDATATNGQIVQREVPVKIAAGQSRIITECDWVGFLATDYIMADQWPALTIEFTMNGNQILASATGGAQWNITNQYFTLDIINYSSALESFMSLFSRQPGVISPISYAFDRYVVQLQAGQASTTNTITFNISSSNLRKVMYSYRKNGFATPGPLANGAHAPNYFIFSAGDAGANFKTSQLFVNGKRYHQYDINLYTDDAGNIDPSGLLDTLVSLGLESDVQYDHLIETHNRYVTAKFCHIYNFDWRGSGANQISGLNTMGQSDMQLVVRSDNALTAGGQWVLIAQTSAICHVNPGRVISIEY